MKTTSQIIRNLVSGWISMGFRTLLAMFMVPFLLKYTGKEGYGLIGLLGVIVSMTGIADLGLRSALGRELAEQVARNNRRGFNELISTAFILYLLIGGTIASCAFLLAPWLASVLKVSEPWYGEAVWMMRVYGSASIVMSFITPVYSAALSSNNRFDVINSVGVIGGIFSSLLLIVFLILGTDPLQTWVWVMLMSQITVLAIKVGYCKKYCDHPEIRLRHAKVGRLGSLFRLGGSMYALQMTQVLSERSDPLVISYFFGPAGVALYQPGGRLSQMIRPAVLLLANQMHPLTTRQHVDRNTLKMQRILVEGTKYTLLFGSLFSAGMLVFSQPFARIWLEKSIGTDYQVAGFVMFGWALVDMTVYAAGTQFAVLLGMKRLKFLVWTQIPTAAVNFLVSIYFVRFTSFGIPGVLIATVLVGFLRRPILICYTARACGVRILDYVMRAYLPPFACFACCLIAGYAIRALIPPVSFCTLLLGAGLVAVVWGLSCWFVGLSEIERGIAKNHLNGMRRLLH